MKDYQLQDVLDSYEDEFPKVVRRAIQVCKRIVAQEFSDQDQANYAILPVLLDHSLGSIYDTLSEGFREASKKKSESRASKET